ncbi:MAG: lysophospholipid acyltransferase family protein [Microthrixaceae bacterium]|jgi:1-acyl-sn-glycerol-3-phosphate acyltransferase|nr:1-acyl-sn-glycerol-3-phosphate acyltransferase [Actinomycetota bacterium]MBP6729024.1 1-acyl-sn-glycerol-3-phosphate acyltransferase [Microthrixaceae bacterium]
MIAGVVYRLIHVAARLLTGAYWRLKIVGRERLPTSGPFVIAPVHRSNLDFLLAGIAVPRPVRYLAKSSVFLGGPIDRFLASMGAIPVDRNIADITAVRACEAALADGWPVVVFPEGRRKSGPVVEDLFDGPAFLACRARIPVVPVGIGGSDAAMPIGSKFIRPHRVVIVVGEPIYPDVPAEGRVPRSAVRELTARVRDEVQRLYDEAAERAGVPN